MYTRTVRTFSVNRAREFTVRHPHTRVYMPRRDVRAVDRHYLRRGCDISRGGASQKRGGLANMSLTAWGGLLECRSQRWLRQRADSIAPLDVGGGGGGGGDDDGDAAVAAAGERRLSIFPRSLRDRNTPVHISALASPVDGLPVLRDSCFAPPLPQTFYWIDVYRKDFFTIGTR